LTPRKPNLNPAFKGHPPTASPTVRRKRRKKQKEEEARVRLLKKQVKEIEEAILVMEQKIETIELTMCAPDFYDNLTLASEINLSYEDLKQQLSELTDSWELALMALETESL